MRKIDQLLSEYGESHRNETNKTIHWVCVPLIFFSIVGLIASMPSTAVENFVGGEGNPYANWALVALVLVLIYYVSLSIPLSIGMAVFGLLCLVGVRFISQSDVAPLWLVSVIIF